MFGALVDGQQVEYGTLLLAEMDMDSRRQRVFAVRAKLNCNPHCLIVPEAGSAFMPSSAWLNDEMWNVTSHAEFCVDPQQFEISNRAPKQGEIAYVDGDWLIPATTDQRRPERLHWISVAQGCPIETRGAALLRFPSWSLTLKGDRTATLFKHQPKGSEPWLIAS